MENKDLDNLLDSLSLTDAETPSSKIPLSSVEQGLQENCNSLVGKVLSARDVSPKGLLGAMQQSWKYKSLKLTRIAGNLFQFFFADNCTPSLILDEGHWCFENHLIVLKRWTPDWKDCQNLFDSTDFWIHLVRLPSHFYSEAVGTQILKDWPECSAGQIRSGKDFGEKFFRFRVSVDCNMPIRRFYCLQLPGFTTSRGLIQYERLPKLCKKLWIDITHC